MLHVVDSRTDVDQGLHHGMLGHILDAPAIDVDLATVANGIQVLISGSDHGGYLFDYRTRLRETGDHG